MNRSRVMVGAVLLPVVVGLGSVYRHGEWSLGPSSPAARYACLVGGGQEVDLLLVHRCAPDSSRAPRPGPPGTTNGAADTRCTPPPDAYPEDHDPGQAGP